MIIQRIKHQDIDKQRYDEIISNASNGTLYALSWYLDIVFPQWQLLATPDYSYVMPLPQKRKLGIPYVIQPLMNQQLGVFSQFEISQDVINTFLDKIIVPYCYIQLNAGNVTEQNSLPLRPNYVLDINRNYNLIQASYHKNTKTNLRKAYLEDLCIEEELTIDQGFQFVRENSPYYTAKVYTISQKIIDAAAERNILFFWGVKERVTSQTVAVGAFVLWRNCFYYLLTVSSEEGKKRQAMRFLLDQFIRKYAQVYKQIDFEGSAISSVAQFYKGFGAELKPYPFYRKNSLPFFIKK